MLLQSSTFGMIKRRIYKKRDFKTEHQGQVGFIRVTRSSESAQMPFRIQQILQGLLLLLRNLFQVAILLIHCKEECHLEYALAVSAHIF